MQLLTTAGQMQQLDSLAINKYSLPGIVLMENAGRAFADVLERRVGSFSGKSVLVVCGKGNNGGDGFVIARHVANRGGNVHVALLCKKNDVKGDARTNLDVVLKMASAKDSSLSFEEASTPRRLSRLPASSIIVDAIFGTGFTGAVHGVYGGVITWINEQQCFVASVDMPSGTNASNGIVENISVKADLTITMGLGKIGHYTGAGRDHSGSVSIVDISIPGFLFTPSKEPVFRVEVSDLKAILPKRPLWAHKNSVGRVFVLAGSRSLTGAPFMTSQSAMRTGAGAVVLGVPKSIHNSLIRKATEVMVTPLDETDAGTISLAALDAIQEKVKWADVVALGPGLSMNEETQQVVRHLLLTAEKPVVLDADGINALAAKPKLMKKRSFPTIMTPHVGELRNLTGLDAVHIECERVEVARKSAQQFRSTVCLKGSPTAVGTPKGTVLLNSTGNPGMATAGSGDVLTGIISSLVGQGVAPEEAAWAGVFIHGMAGDRAAKRLGERGLMALDILNEIPETLQSIEAAC